MAEVIYQVRKATAVPSAPTTPNTIFYIALPNSTYVEMYVSNAAGDTVKRIINESDVKALIASQLSSVSKYTVVADITSRNALADKSTLVYVKNATGDNTVKSGGATYLYDTGAGAWVKMSEAESMDLSFDWSNLTNKPNSTVAAIDAAVNKSHTHANQTQLDNISELNGKLAYKGAYVQVTINDAW